MTISRPLPRSQIFTVKSRLALATYNPSGLYASALTRSAWRIRDSPSTRVTCAGKPGGK